MSDLTIFLTIWVLKIKYLKDVVNNNKDDFLDDHDDDDGGWVYDDDDGVKINALRVNMYMQ